MNTKLATLVAVAVFAVVGCSGAQTQSSGQDDGQLRTRLVKLKKNNAKLGKQLAGIDKKAFHRATTAEKHRGVASGKARLVRATTGGRKIQRVTLGPLKFKHKARTFFLNLSSGHNRGSLVDQGGSISIKGGK